MKKTFIFIALAVLGSLTCRAQENYQISGKVSGMNAGTLLLVRDDGMKPDTVATTDLKNGVFVFAGKTNAPFGGYITTGDGSLTIPIVVEPANIMINVTPNGALVQGGKQQQLFAAYNLIGQAFAAEQARIQAEAQQPGADINALQARVDQAYRQSMEKTNDLIRANANEYATAYVIAIGARNETPESLQQKYNLLGEEAKASVPGKRIEATIERFDKLEPGKDAPDFTANMPNGDSFSLHALPARFKLIVFWTSTDNASRQMNPALIQLYQKFRPRGLEIVSVSLDDNLMAWRKAIELDGISIWTNGSDLKGWNSDIANLYMVNAVPYTVLVGDENKIAAKGLSVDEITRQLNALTKKKKK